MSALSLTTVQGELEDKPLFIRKYIDFIKEHFSTGGYNIES